jgi:hypothetical protein
MRVFPQSSVTVNENGTYYIARGIVKKIPSDVDLGAGYFWKNYIVFCHGPYADKMLIYNTNNGATSGFLMGGSDETHIYGQYVYIEKGRNLFFNINGFEYELDLVTLKTINRATVIDKTLDYDWSKYDQYMIDRRLIGERTIRYFGEKYYFDITVGQKIDISNRGNWYIQGGKYDERFVLTVTDTNYTNQPR